MALTSRCFMLLLYPDYQDFQTQLDTITKTFDKWAYIQHDRDVTPEGELKKPHLHLVIYLTEAETPQWVYNKLGGILPVNYIEKYSPFRKAVRYLIHLDDPSKYQYSSADIHSNFDVSPYLKSSVDDTDLVFEILDFIDNADFAISVNYLLIHMRAEKKEWYSAFRRNFSIIREYLVNRNALREFKQRKDIMQSVAHTHNNDYTLEMEEEREEERQGRLL